MAFVTLTAHPKSFRNRIVIDIFGGINVLPLYVLEFSVGVGLLSNAKQLSDSTLVIDELASSGHREDNISSSLPSTAL